MHSYELFSGLDTMTVLFSCNLKKKKNMENISKGKP